jgi:hypothetical protein
MDPLTITSIALATGIGALVIGGIGTALVRNKISRKRSVHFSPRSQCITTRRVSTSISQGKPSKRRTK